MPVDELQRRHRIYREVSLEAGRSLREIEALEAQSWGMRVVHVAPSRAEALQAVEAPFMGYQHKMAVLRSDGTGGSVPNSFDRSLLRLRSFEEYLATGWTLLGTADEVREGLQQYLEATGYQRVLLLMALPGLPTGLGAALDAAVRRESGTGGGRRLTAWLLLNAGAAVAAGALARAAGAGSRATPLPLAGLAGYLVLVHSVVLGAGLTGSLTVGGLAVPVVLVVGVALALAHRTGRSAGRDSGAAVRGRRLRLARGTRGWTGVGVAAPGARHAAVDLGRLHLPHGLSRAVAAAARDRAPSPGAGVHDAGVVSAVGQRRGRVVHGAVAGIARRRPGLGEPHRPALRGARRGRRAALLARAGCRPGAWAVPAALLLTSPRIGDHGVELLRRRPRSGGGVARRLRLRGAARAGWAAALRADAWYAAR